MFFNYLSLECCELCENSKKMIADFLLFESIENEKINKIDEEIDNLEKKVLELYDLTNELTDSLRAHSYAIEEMLISRNQAKNHRHAEELIYRNETF